MTLNEAMDRLATVNESGKFRVNASNVLDAALCALPNTSDLRVLRLDVLDRVANIELLSPNRIEAINVGDLVQGGLSISLVADQLELRPKYHRLRCKNGFVGVDTGNP